MAHVAEAILGDKRIAFEVISRMVQRVGVFAEVGPGIFGFIHKVFADYFVAWSFRDNLVKLTELLSHEDGEAVLEFASGMVENPAVLVERAVSRGQLVLAARMASSGRYDNRTLQTYVAQAFRRALEPGFLDLLVDRIEESDSTRATSPKEYPHSVSPAIAVLPDAGVQPAGKGDFIDSAPAYSSSAYELPTSEGMLELLDGVRNERLPNEQRGKLFETFTARFFGALFRVAYTNYLTDRGEIDLILELERGGLYWADFGNEALVECKNLRKKATYDQTATFITKVAQSRRRLGFIVSYLGFTQDALWAIHDNATDRSAPLVIPITGDDIRKSLQLSEAPEEFFKNAYRNVTIPRRGRRSTRSRKH